MALLSACGDDTRILAERELPDAPTCDERSRPDDVMLLRFEESTGAKTVVDARGAHPGTVRAGGVVSVSGPSACGAAMLFEPGPGGFPLIEVPHHPDFNLASGSLRFWLRLPAGQQRTRIGIVSRDAFREMRPGHLTVYWVESGHLVVRLQGATQVGGRCSDVPLARDVWTNVGINFGPLGFQLFVNGVEQTAAPPDIFVPTSSCGTNTTDGIDGNENPWVIGANADGSDEGSADPVEGFAQGVAIDNFRLSGMRLPR
ncbi:MAG: LamG-like jellyroll fold domain-containing protein [Deltaproteobacteria bacterium]|nr:LamG-like jellyroll fold domain-containing protein [Deltaproteobacteria bacterium]